MTAVVLTLTVVVALLAVLVAGLLRSHATILARLHELDGGPAGTPAFRTAPGIPAPERSAPVLLDDPAPVRRAPDVVGTTPDGEAVVVRTSGDAGTVLLFLSSGCATCRAFWDELAAPAGITLPPGARLLVVTKGPEQESVSAVAELASPTAEVVLSTRAWADYAVPGSPYVVAVDGPTGRVVGEGTGGSWSQVARLLAQATGDLAYLPGTTRRAGKPAADVDREARADRELMAAGIFPGDDSLYRDPATAPVDDAVVYR
ncbi:TlpA family protein disulfide reductase [Nakamurella endophytica]|uniref:Thioredoxin domain-containing protein n=1 Tax=Nakamurella endophytica TaxID=1748367 RepID=A0A917WP38_9ACTN|nr:hypothetical protein [Nakamurella endophytica]GGM18422.1 hypothetical protein GCM10011594_43130 [Nakamurella endophytica]